MSSTTQLPANPSTVDAIEEAFNSVWRTLYAHGTSDNSQAEELKIQLSQTLVALGRKDATMETRATRYRGYLIEGNSPGLGWLIEVHPSKPDLPILRQAAFRVAKPSWREAVAQARARIDASLSVGELMNAARIVNIGGSGQYE